jgi:flagellar hook-associated protein 3 FlgL
LSLANTKYLGEYIFSGSNVSTQAYDSSGAWQGDTNKLQRNVAPGLRIGITVSGVDVFGSGATSIFTALDDLVTNLPSNQGAAATASPAIEAALSNAQKALAEVGSRANRLDAIKQVTDEQHASMKFDLSSLEDVDIEKAMLDVQTRQVAYQAALTATSRVIQPSLADFLR